MNMNAVNTLQASARQGMSKVLPTLRVSVMLGMVVSALPVILGAFYLDSIGQWWVLAQPGGWVLCLMVYLALSLVNALLIACSQQLVGFSVQAAPPFRPAKPQEAKVS